MDATEIRRSIEAGTDYWNWITGEYIFHDDDFDEERDDNCTFGLSRLDMGEVMRSYTNDVLAGYHSSNDGDIDRDDAAERIATEHGWHQLGVDDPIWVDMARASAGM